MKRFKQHIEEGKSFKYYYHATFTSTVDKIKSKGLQPFNTSNWVKGDGKRYNEYAGVYAFQHPEDCFMWALKMEWDFKKPISIVRIKKSNKWEKDPSEDIHLQMGKGDAMMAKGVPANHIVDAFRLEDFGKPGTLGISQAEWLKRVMKGLTRPPRSIEEGWTVKPVRGHHVSWKTGSRSGSNW